MKSEPIKPTIVVRPARPDDSLAPSTIRAIIRRAYYTTPSPDSAAVSAVLPGNRVVANTMNPEEHKRIVDDALKIGGFVPPAVANEGERIMERFIAILKDVREETQAEYELAGRSVRDRKEFSKRIGNRLLERLSSWDRMEVLFVLVTTQGWMLSNEF